MTKKSIFKTGAICWSSDIENKSKIKGRFFNLYFDKKENEIIKSGHRLIIETQTKEKAQQIFNLFIASLSLLEGQALFSIDDIPEVQELSTISNITKNNAIFSQAGIFKAAKLTSKASFRKKLYYSLYKYLIASNLHSNDTIDLVPFHTEYYKLSRNPLHHIRYGYAIMIFYSILEELQLEIRATTLNPSRKDGKWSEPVKNDLETRLANAGVDISEKAHWILRSKPSKIHNEKLYLLKKFDWAKYDIRDSEIEIIDAINYLSWLRSKVVAHKFGKELLSISIYDVANANFLVRQILLDIFNK